MKKFTAFLYILFAVSFSALSVYAADLTITMDDVRIVRDPDSGFHLYIRKKPDVQSVLLTETTKDPNGKVDNYAYRSSSWNVVNGDELRMLDGTFLSPESKIYSLIDSTAEADSVFAEAFHIYIPEMMEWGYPWTRQGVQMLQKGTFINIRAFENTYGDYRGSFYDNPFVLDLVPRAKPVVPQPVSAIEPLGEPEPEPVFLDDFNPVTIEKLSEINNKSVAYSRGDNDIIDKIQQSISPPNPDVDLELVLTIDATGSMDDDIEAVRQFLIPMLQDMLPLYKSFKIALLLYKDYGDDFRYKNIPVRLYDFTDNLDTFKKNLNGFTVSGGFKNLPAAFNFPEPVYEALYASAEFFNWTEGAIHKIILIGDAEPHPYPFPARWDKSKEYTKGLVEDVLEQYNIEMDMIILVDSKRVNK